MSLEPPDPQQPSSGASLVKPPLVRLNDWTSLTPPRVGHWSPTKRVSVVLPAWGGRDLSPVMAALAAQTYPSELLEVVVVDDGNPVPVELPELRPENSRVLRVSEGWGRAGATQVGMDATDGEIVLWLDDDMLPFAEHVEAHARWHHLCDNLVVMGVKRFVDPHVPLTPQQVRDAVRDGSIGQLHDWESATPHTWIDEIWADTADLADAGTAAFRCFVSATASMSRAMVDAVGPMSLDMRLGEDTEYGHRLAQAGAVLVPEHGARAWHLGNSHVMDQAEAVSTYNQPAFADRIPSVRRRRMLRGRVYEVPYLEVVVDVGGPLREVQRTVDAFLDSELSDLAVTLRGPFDQVHDERVSPLNDPLRDLGVLHRRYRNEPRVRMVLPDDASLTHRPGAMFRMVVGSAGLVPLAVGPRAWVDDMERARLGLRVFVDAEGAPVARLERVAAFARAEWSGEPFFARRPSVADSSADALVEAAYGVARVPALESGWVPWKRRSLPRDRRQDLTAVDRDESWQMVLDAVAADRSTVKRRPRGEGAVAREPGPGTTPKPKDPVRGLLNRLRGH